jgi:hypothetical protein
MCICTSHLKKGAVAPKAVKMLGSSARLPARALKHVLAPTERVCLALKACLSSN